MIDDAAYEEATRLIMEDENVDVGFIACVPLTPALQTILPGPGYREDVRRYDSVAMRMARLKKELRKPWIASVDGGTDYDPMARILEENGVPTFRTADRALRLFSRYCVERLKRSVD
jgi:acyl-CoA synthetase (NDP forming)